MGKVSACLWNHNAKQITLPKQMAVGEIAAANAIPALLAPQPTENESVGAEATTKKKRNERANRTFGQIDLTGLWHWSF